MSVTEEFTLDFARPERIGLEEAIFCAGKSPEQMLAENFDRARSEESAVAKFGSWERTAAEWHEVGQTWAEPYSESGFPGICRIQLLLTLPKLLPKSFAVGDGLLTDSESADG